MAGAVEPDVLGGHASHGESLFRLQWRGAQLPHSEPLYASPQKLVRVAFAPGHRSRTGFRQGTAVLTTAALSTQYPGRGSISYPPGQNARLEGHGLQSSASPYGHASASHRSESRLLAASEQFWKGA